MEVPKYNELYQPLLELMSTQVELRLADMPTEVCNYLRLPAQAVQEVYPGTNVRMLKDRISWACTYLYKTGLVERLRRGVYALTAEGRRVLAMVRQGGVCLDNDFLKRYPAFVAFKSPAKSATNHHAADVAELRNETPDEALNAAFASISRKLEEEVLAEVLSHSPSFFERLVIELLQKMGYGSELKHLSHTTPATGDGGIDAVIYEDKLGFNLIYAQAKRWEPGNIVGRAELQKFVGALSACSGANKGLFITTSDFSANAVKYAESQSNIKLVLINGQKMAKLMIELELGVSTIKTFAMKQLDADYFASLPE